MRKLLLATAATAAATLVIATPAAARDGSGYVGIEGGVTKPLSQDLFGAINFTDTTVGNFSRTDIGSPEWNTNDGCPCRSDRITSVISTSRDPQRPSVA